MNLEEGEGEPKIHVRKRKRNINNNNTNNNDNDNIFQRCLSACASCRFSRCLRVVIVLQVVLLLFFSTLYLQGYHKDAWMYVSYYTRPLWDSAGPPPFEVIQHFYAEGVPLESLCKVNGWKYVGETPNRVIDAVLFSNELDLLEIRLRELLPVVDHFFIVESDKTFTDRPKEKTFTVNRERFDFAKEKIVYGLFVAPPVTPEQASRGFPLEAKLRDFMTDLLIKNGVRKGDRVIMSDIDEIPSRNTVSLLKNCDGYPDIMHLGMKNYLYSFEFPITHQAGYVGISPGSYQWRPQVHKWNYPDTFYKHSESSKYLLADSGWHCSFCFRYIDDFVFKMVSYSHSDRVRHANFLDHARIQKIVCEGSDIFGMPAESFTWYDVLLNLYNPPPTKDLVHLPMELVEHPDKYSFLLPGNCTRPKR